MKREAWDLSQDCEACQRLEMEQTVVAQMRWHVQQGHFAAQYSGMTG